MSFLVVTPLGLSQAPALLRRLGDLGIAIAGREDIGPWSAAATWLYGNPQRTGGIALVQRFEIRWRTLFPRDIAERWFLADPADHACLTAAKSALRASFLSTPLDEAPVAGEPVFALHAFHVPDAADVPVESRRLDAFVLTALPSSR